jgi:Caspase domain
VNQKDFAIIVGISHYPGLRNLQAPDRDAQMIYDWLISEDGGAVPAANIQLVTSSQFPPTDRAINAQPTADQIARCFRTYVDEAPAGGKVGRRLYIYMSGHGVSPDTSRGGLVTAEANDRWLQYIYASAWVKWLEDAGYFEELVLWMDCCMDRFLTLATQSLPLFPEAAQTPPGPSFIALAAPRPLRTVEQPIIVGEDPVVHGIFTWTLLQGLKGHAANEDGSITGRSLGDYLLNTMKEFFNPQPQAGAGIAIEPEIVKGDPKLIFRSPNVVASPSVVDGARGAVEDLDIFPAVDRPSYSVKLIFHNSAIGMMARLWTGTRSTEIDISTSEVELNLERGLYAIEVPTARLRQGFEVTGSGITAAILIDQLGEIAIDPPTASTSFVLDVDTGDPTAEIFIIDRSFRLTDRGIGRLTVTKPAGIYKIKMRIGRDITEKIVLLDRDRLDLQLVLPKLTSAAPLDGSGLLHEYHENAIRSMRSTIHVRAGMGGQLCLMARNWGGNADSDNSILPWHGTTLVDGTGRIVVDLAVDGMHELHQDPIGGCNAELDPGTYYLRRQLTDDRVIEQSLIVCDGWRTEAFLLKSPVHEQESQDRHRLAIFMHRISDEHPDYTIDLTIDAARIALTDRRSILNADLERILLLKFDNPIAGIIGAHLLIMEHDRAENIDRQPSLDLLDPVVLHLRNLVGNHHPDVEALSLRCVNPMLRASQPFRSPPMLVFSWQLAIEASKSNPQLIPLELWQQVRANVECTSYFAWASDPESRNVNQQQLAAWIEAVKQGSPLTAPTEGTARGGRSLSEIKSALFDRSDLKIPATALETLWDRSP